MMSLPLLPGEAYAAREIDPAFMQIKDCPDQPGCPALILLDESELDNDSNRTRYSRRQVVKVFTQEGIDRFGEVTQSATVGGWDVRNLSGRTILPDGTQIELKQDNVTVKVLRRGKRREKVKSATFPGIVPGAIIESSYDVLTSPNSFFVDMVWEVQQHLPVLTSRFILKPGKYDLGWTRSGTEMFEIKESSPSKKVKVLTAVNVPAIPDEPWGPPEDSIRTRVYFGLPDMQRAWLGHFAGKVAGHTGAFVSDGKGVAEKVKELVGPNDSPTVKLQKIYRFVQESIGTEEERAARSDEGAVKDAENAGEVLARGYGSEFERTLLFISMAQAAGMESALLLIVSRYGGTLDDKAPDESQFDSFAAAVKAGPNWTFYDPAARHCPFGMISAEKEGGTFNAVQIRPQKGAGLVREAMVKNLMLKVNQPSSFMIAAIPFSAAGKNVLTRSAAVRLTEDGGAEADVTEKGTGLFDLSHREIYERLTEDKRLETLKERLRDLLPDAEVSSASFTDIESFDKPAVIEYRLRIPEAAGVLGERIILTPSLYGSVRTNPFTLETRRSAVHFPFRRRVSERFAFSLPEGYAAKEIPESIIIRDTPFLFTMTFSSDDGEIVLNRRLEIDTAVWPAADYPRLRDFMRKVQEADGTAIVLTKEPAS